MTIRSKISETLKKIWTKPKKMSLSDLWQPSDLRQRLTRQELLDKFLASEKEEAPNPAEEKRRLKEQRKAKKLAKKMTKLVTKGKISLVEVLPLAFPELDEWKVPSPPKTENLKTFDHVDVPDDAIASLAVETKSFRAKVLSEAIAGAILFLDAGGTDDDALTILSSNCGPLTEEALSAAKMLKLVQPSKRQEEFARQISFLTEDPRWQEYESRGIL